MPQIREQIAMVHLPPSKTLKYLFHVRKTKRADIWAALIKQHKIVFGKRYSFCYAVSPFCRLFSKDAGSIPTRS